MSRQSSRAARSATPPAIPTMSVSEFLRGGVYKIDTPTTVMSHSQELGTWYPRGQGLTTSYYSSTTSDLSGSQTNTLAAGPLPVTGVAVVDIHALNSAVAQLREYLSQATKEEDPNGNEEEGR